MKTWKILMVLGLLLPFAGKAQDEGYLYENFNKTTLQNFPPYGWRMIDADGDGSVWMVAADGDEGTMAATSYIWLMGSQNKPDNWLITPALAVEKETDSIKYWLGSYIGQSNYFEVWVARKGYALEDFKVRIDSVTFDQTEDHYNRAISLKDFLGDTVYVGFRHLYKNLPDIDETINVALDNVQGPRIVRPTVDLGVEEILVFDNVSEPCDITDEPITVVVANLGATSVSGFDIYGQASGYRADGSVLTTPLQSARIDRTLAPGDTLHYTFSESIPFSQYDNQTERIVLLRAFLNIPNDAWEGNDTLVTGFYKQNSFRLPMEVGFESDSVFQNWYLGFIPEGASMSPFSIGMNQKFAHTGTSYLSCGVYAPFEGIPQTGEDAFAATRCVFLEKGDKYRLDMFYGFRKLPSTWENQSLHFKVVAGKDQQNMLQSPHTVLFDTILEKTEDLITLDKAIYTLFSSQDFGVEETGAYYIGLVFYSDSLVKIYSDEWMIFVDDLALRRTQERIPIDLALESIELPYDCNLTAAEEIRFVIRNNSMETVSGVRAGYRINNKEEVVESISDPLPPNAAFVYTFKQKADFSDYRKYKVDGMIYHDEDAVADNNENTGSTINSEIMPMPFADDFEDYGITLNFEDEWRVYSQGYFTWMAAVDYTPDTLYAYNGIGFLADASDNERFVGQNDWLIGRCLSFVKDSTYEISFAYRIEQEGTGKASLNAWLLASYDTASKVVEVARLTDIRNTEYTIRRMEFTPEESFIGHFSFHSFGEVGAPIIMIDALRIGEKGSTTANEEYTAADIRVYPNPAREVLYVRAGGIDVASVELYNLLGQKTDRIETRTADCELNVSRYTPGLYFLQITDRSGKRYVKRIVIGK